MMIQTIPPGKMKTYNLCRLCVKSPDTCKASRVFGEFLRVRGGYSIQKNVSKRVVACDKYNQFIGIKELMK